MPVCYTDRMKTPVLQTLLERVHTWPKEAEEDAVKALREIEEDFIIGPSTRQELDRSHQEALRGEGVDMEELYWAVQTIAYAGYLHADGRRSIRQSHFH